MISKVYFDGSWHTSIDSCHISIDQSPCTIIKTSKSPDNHKFTHVVKFADGTTKKYSDKTLTDILNNERKKIKEISVNNSTKSNSSSKAAPQGVLDL